MDTKTYNLQTLSEKDRNELERFRSGFPWMQIEAAAGIGRGIVRLDPSALQKAVARAEAATSSSTSNEGRPLRFSKFVPASGAASRMFKDLFNKNVTVVNKFVSDIEKFAFYDAELYKDIKGEDLVDFTLSDSGLGYGSKPKGVLKFHRYPDEVRTAIAEHMVEAQEYMKDAASGTARMTVTISPEHTELFKEAIARVQESYEKKYSVRYDISLTYQHKWTDTIAATPDNAPFVLEDGSVLHRPAGHGALIHNLSAVDADVVSIKNIDNVAVESYLPVTAQWKKALIGTALELRGEIFSYMDRIVAGEEGAAGEAADFLKTRLCIELPKETLSDAKLLKDKVMELLDRPIRVCGMVKNEGEPGGGPFIIREKDGSTSLQILEGSQINMEDSHAVQCLKNATHFNPVDLVCVLTDRRGNHFKLEDFVDPEAGFISSKSYKGRELKALELPGLWNGAMSRWNTLFVEVPVETFNPVKTVMDLLRPAHQA